MNGNSNKYSFSLIRPFKSHEHSLNTSLCGGNSHFCKQVFVIFSCSGKINKFELELKSLNLVVQINEMDFLLGGLSGSCAGVFANTFDVRKPIKISLDNE